MTAPIAVTASAPPDRADRRDVHWVVLWISLAIIVLSALLTTVNERRIAVAGWSQFPLPELCQSRRWFGLDCPGCGLTRSFIHFFHGRWAESFHMHRFGWLLAVLTILQIPYRLVALALHWGRPLGTVFPSALLWGTAVLFAVNWLLKMTGL